MAGYLRVSTGVRATEGFSLAEQRTGTSTGRLFRNILGALAKFERETINERVVGGMAEKATQGKRAGGPVP